MYIHSSTIDEYTQFYNNTTNCERNVTSHMIVWIGVENNMWKLIIDNEWWIVDDTQTGISSNIYELSSGIKKTTRSYAKKTNNAAVCQFLLGLNRMISNFRWFSICFCSHSPRFDANYLFIHIHDAWIINPATVLSNQLNQWQCTWIFLFRRAER